jgi:FKBP-type peptidyl-prolyl cis-trans isomerase
MNRISQIVTSLILIVAMIACQEKKEEKVNLRTSMDSISYIIGYDYGEGVKNQHIDVNSKAMYHGFKDAMQGKGIIEDSIKKQIIDRFNKVLAKNEEKRKALAMQENIENGKKFMEEIAKEEGIRKTENGVYYKVIKEGEGSNPKLGDSVVVHYQASFIDGKVFDDSYQWGPAIVKVGEAISGLNEAMQMMSPGGQYILYIPPALGYGNYNFANIIPPGSTLIYKFELIRIKQQ